jgi:multicomponent Na+:H+ antiporter subunit E
VKKAFIKGSILQFFVLFGLWILLSGRFDLFHISMGFLSALLVILVHLRINRYLYFQKEIAKENTLRYSRFLYYVPWLIWQIVVASIQVAYVVLHPKIPINPSLVRFKTRLPNIAAKVILGNSITLTPGTLTIRIQDDEFLVHALTDAASTSIMDGSLPDQVAKLYHRRPSSVIREAEVLKTAKNI